MSSRVTRASNNGSRCVGDQNSAVPVFAKAIHLVETGLGRRAASGKEGRGEELLTNVISALSSRSSTEIASS